MTRRDDDSGDNDTTSGPGPIVDPRDTDPFGAFKAAQKQRWASFVAFEMLTTPVAARLVRFVGVAPGQRWLDVACGTGVVAVTAARQGACVTGLDLTPDLLVRAREHAAIGGVSIDWHEGDVEALPFDDGTFDVVVSEFGHIFAPRPAVALAEMLRVLRRGGTIAFASWPPELFMGRMFALAAQYQPPPDPAPAPPAAWGDPAIVRERLGEAVQDVGFDRGRMHTPALSPAHYRIRAEQTSAAIARLVETLAATDPDRLDRFRRDYDALTAEYFGGNVVRQDFLLTRATKR